MEKKTAEDRRSITLWLASRKRGCVPESSGSPERQAVRWRSSTSLRARAARRFAAGLVLAAVLPGPSRAAFQNALITPRSASMGGSALASPGDTGALFQAPASPATLTNGELYFQYQQYNAGLKGAGSIGQGYVTAGAPTRFGSLAVGVSDFRAAGLMNERVVGLGWSKRVLPWLDFGVTGKYLHHSYSIGGDALAEADPVFRNGSARGAFGLDAGAAVHPTPEWTLGASLRNINRPDVGLDSPDPVAREAQLGAAYLFKQWDLRAVGDVTFRDQAAGSADRRAIPSAGLEKGFENGKVLFRAGVGLDQFSAGVGLNLGRFGFDYAFVLSRRLVADSAGTHQIGIRYRFGGDDAK